jgi:hypothetical protein
VNLALLLIKEPLRFVSPLISLQRAKLFVTPPPVNNMVTLQNSAAYFHLHHALDINNRTMHRSELSVHTRIRIYIPQKIRVSKSVGSHAPLRSFPLNEAEFLPDNPLLTDTERMKKNFATT